MHCIEYSNTFFHVCALLIALYLSRQSKQSWKQRCAKNEKIFMEKCDRLNVVKAIVTDRLDSGCSPVINTRWPGAKFVIFAAINRAGVRYGFPFDKGAESAYKFRWPRDSGRINIFLTSSFFHPTSLFVRSIGRQPLEYAWRRAWHTARARGRAPS